MKIAVIGNSFFGQKIAKQLDEFDKNNSYIFYDTNAKTIDKIKYILNLPFISRVYLLSATISGGGALKLAQIFNKKIIQHFIGSDVLVAKEDFANKRVDKNLIKKSKYLVEVEWIQKELQEIFIESKVESLMAFDTFTKPQMFKNFSVLTYINRSKEKFYGIDDFIKLAKHFPDIEFKIAGISSYRDLPKNISCLGWVDMTKELQESTVFIRNVKHDGLSFSILESLSLGRVTFYNYNFAYTNYFKDFNNLLMQFTKVVDDYKNSKIDINYDAIDFIKNKFNKERVLNSLVEAINE
jgi:glycosyltransferase involved in cell wall biosynthesis